AQAGARAAGTVTRPGRGPLRSVRVWFGGVVASGFQEIGSSTLLCRDRCPQSARRTLGQARPPTNPKLLDTDPNAVSSGRSCTMPVTLKAGRHVTERTTRRNRLRRRSCLWCSGAHATSHLTPFGPTASLAPSAHH